MDNKKIIINSRIIKHLGKDLITSSDVAITEIVKNSLDAKAQNIKLHLLESLNGVKECKSLIIPVEDTVIDFIPKEYHCMPTLIIEDDGIGMNNFQLDHGFLEIGTEIKLHNTGNNIHGQKGIGRLATQRLGHYLVVETASSEEAYATLTSIDWNHLSATVSQGNHYEVPHKKCAKSINNYTRLWVIGINVSDFIDSPIQLSMEENSNSLIVNRELKSALNFLVSPFSENPLKPKIDLFFNDKLLDIDFPFQMLSLSECTHFFRLNIDNSQLGLEYSLELEPWYLERMHRGLVKPEAFKRLKKSHTFYSELLKNNKERIFNVLKKQLNETDIFDLVVKEYIDLFDAGIKNKDSLRDYANQRAEICIEAIKNILPIEGSIHNFKQNSAVVNSIIIESLKEADKLDPNISLKNLKTFLGNYNGIKLYRGLSRIGFLGNRDNDWLNLQQYRTKGQQWYRFDLGNTVGYVSINDPKQNNIQEISSRLDISQNEVSDSFKLLVNIIFNKLFYELNRTAYSIISVIYKENGLLSENVTNRVKRNTSEIVKMMNRSRKMMEKMDSLATSLYADASVDGDVVRLSKSTYDFVSKAFSEIKGHFIEDQSVQKEAVSLLVEAGEQLKAIEIESYNNFKLMANGLITETITHELHSISKTSIDYDADMHFEFLKTFFVQNKSTNLFNQHVYPIKNSYDIISGKMIQVADLYSFLENTFIKKGTYDEFVNQNILSVIESIHENLIKITRESKVAIECETRDLCWFVPKGVLLHVFYNLFNNSLYWIDMRRKFATTDSKYVNLGVDRILVEEYSSNEIVVSDTGTGVLALMEDILFEPLQSGKPHGEGRGMGLYIVKKLMNSFEGDIELMPDLNIYGNRYKFLITLNSRAV